MNGSYISYFDDGKIKNQTQYENGVEFGNFYWFHPNGNIKNRGYLKNGLKEGIYEVFDKLGKRILKKSCIKNRFELMHS